MRSGSPNSCVDKLLHSQTGGDPPSAGRSRGKPPREMLTQLLELDLLHRRCWGRMSLSFFSQQDLEEFGQDSLVART